MDEKRLQRLEEKLADDKAEENRDPPWQCDWSPSVTSKDVRELIDEVRRLSKIAEIRSHEAQHARAQFDSAVERLVRISSFAHPGHVELPDGRRFRYNPPETIVREAWEALSAAVRDSMTPPEPLTPPSAS